MATAEPCIAYLAPEIPALSATFVYEELLGVERRGIRVIPFSVHSPARAVPAQRALAERTQILYAQPAPALAMQGLLALPRFKGRVFRALRWLAADLLSVGPCLSKSPAAVRRVRRGSEPRKQPENPQ